MIRRFNYLKRTFLFALALTLTNCQVDETPIEQQSRLETVTVNEAKALLTQPITTKSSKISTTKLSNLEFDKITQEKINGSDQLLTVIPFATNDKTKNERILLLKIDKEIKSVVFSMYPDKSFSKGGFSGKLVIYSLEGDFINGYRAKNGILITQFVKSNEKTSVSSKLTGKITPLDEVIITNNFHNIQMVNFFYFEAIWGNTGSSSDGSGVQGMSWNYDSGSTGTTITQIIIEKIDDSQLTPCYKNVIDQLKKGTVCEIEKVFSKLNADFSKYNVTFVNGPTTNGKDVADTKKTNPNIKFDYTITIDMNNTYTTSTQLFKANAILHELVHAYFYSLLDDASKTNLSGLIDTPTLFKAFVDKTYMNSTNGDAHHIEMANTYVNAISSALQEFQTGVAVPYGNAQQEYKDLAWHGLEETEVYKQKSGTDKTRIENRFGAESRGGDVGGQKLIGKPCN